MKRKASTIHAVKNILVAATMIVLLVICTSCGKNATGMYAAYESLQTLSEKSEYKAHLNCTYDESEDILTITIDSEMNLKKLFDSLNKAVKGAELGHLAFKTSYYSEYPDEFMHDFGEYLKKLPCNRIQCLTLSDDFLSDEAWTGILDRTEAMYQPDLETMATYSDDGLANLAQLRKLIVCGNDDYYDFDQIRILSGLEELSLSAGLTENERSEMISELEKARSRDEATTSVHEGVILSGLHKFKALNNMSNLKRVIFYPEISGQLPDSKYCLHLLSLQVYAPDVYTNCPGEAWSGNEKTLIAVNNIDVLNYTDNRVVSSAIDSGLKIKAASFYEEGKNYTDTEDEPILRGKCLVYMASPNSFDSNGNPLGDFYTNDAKILRDDFLSYPVSPSDTVTTFVYVYPEYSLVGRYTDNTKAYATTTLVKIYDMDKKLRYPILIADTVDPDSVIYTDGSGGSFHASMRPENVLTFLETMQRN